MFAFPILCSLAFSLILLLDIPEEKRWFFTLNVILNIKFFLAVVLVVTMELQLGVKYFKYYSLLSSVIEYSKAKLLRTRFK